jgi:hypothetical protein
MPKRVMDIGFYFKEQLFFLETKIRCATLATKINKNQRSSFVFALMKCSKSRIWRAKQNEGVS